MTPFMAIVIVTWTSGHAALFRSEVYPDLEMCEIVLEEMVMDKLDFYDGLPIEVDGYCEIPGESEGA